jgi:RNA polymerase sigma-70 factor (ECF subfamily)
VAVAASPAEPLDERSFHDVYQETARPLWAYLYRLVGNAADADDLVQEAYLRLLRAPALSSASERRAYLFRIASNLAVDHWRRASRQTEDTVAVPAARSLDADGDLRHDMELIFRELEPNERAMLWLAYVEGSDHAEIAASLGVKRNSVRVLLFRARKKLAALLERSGITGGS